MKTPEVIYELERVVPMHRNFLGQLITGISLAWCSMWTYGFFKFGFLIAAFFVLVPMISEIFAKQIRGLSLTEQYLELRTGISETGVRIYMSEIKKVKLIERDNQKKRRRKHHKLSEETVLISNQNHGRDRKYERNSVCMVQTNDGRLFEIKSQYFPEGEFGEFLEYLQTVYDQQSNTIKEGSRRKMLKRTTVTPPALSVTPTDKIGKLQQQNRDYLQEDRYLRTALRSKLIEVFKSAYHQRDHFEAAKIENEVVYSYDNNDGNKIYFLRGDYLPNLGAENIEMAENLINASFQNLEVVENRTKYYQKILEQLDKIRFREKSRRKLNSIARELQVLQDKNTSKSIKHSLTDIDVNEAEIEAKVLKELEELTEIVRTTDDINKSLELREHIAIFRETTSA